MNFQSTSPVITVMSRAYLILILALLLTWSVVVRILWSDWMIDPQYGYGFIVPFLVLGLLLRRCRDLPRRSLPKRGDVFLSDIIACCSAVVLAAVIPMAEANPDWRILGVIASCAALTISLLMIYQLGGGVWLEHLAFPCLFFLIAVPWPRNFEQSVMTSLVSWNTDTTIEVLHWLGYEAMRQGNLILLPTGVLGVEEACSGIRSLQGGLMVALFFGEYFRLDFFRRIFLLGIAVLGAMLGNIIRSSLLAIIASSKGMDAVASWHDPAGFLVLLITMASIVGAALFWRKHAVVKSSPSSFTGNSFSASFFSSSASHYRVFAAIACILLFSYAGTEYWFCSHESSLPVASEWDLQPRSGMGVMPVAVPSATLKLLFNPNGFSERWQKLGGEQGQVFYFRWPPGRIAVQSILAMHTPAVCLSNIGMQLETQLAPVNIEVDGISLQFHSWLFRQDGKLVYVFNATPLNVQVSGDVLAELTDSPRGRFRSLQEGLRNHGQRMIEVAFWNLHDEASARKALARYLNEAMVNQSKVNVPEDPKNG